MSEPEADSLVRLLFRQRQRPRGGPCCTKTQLLFEQSRVSPIVFDTVK
jgi:hypothetical protein